MSDEVRELPKPSTPTWAACSLAVDLGISPDDDPYGSIVKALEGNALALAAFAAGFTSAYETACRIVSTGGDIAESDDRNLTKWELLFDQARGALLSLGQAEIEASTAKIRRRAEGRLQPSRETTKRYAFQNPA